MSHIPLYSLWVQAAALVATVGGVAVTLIGLIVSVRWNVRIARRRATLDILLQEQSLEVLVRERTRFAELLDHGNLLKFSAPSSSYYDAKSFIEDVAVLRSAMNRYELIALGIKHSAVDEEIYKGWCRTTLVGEWIACKPLVDKIRTEHGVRTYLKEFETLATKWANDEERGHL